MTRPRATDALLVGAAKLVTSAVVLGTGFRAVSDDDYARIVIAQRFAESPSLDPSGTSWLPVPFWTYGSVFAVFGGSLDVARVTALALGVVSVLLVLVAASWLGANRAGALAAALIACALPWSAWLGAASLPEAPTAGLVVLAVASLSRDDVVRRSLGALALYFACFSRYEAWPVALVFGMVSATDARRRHAWSLAVPAAVAVAPIALWLLHGAVRHHDALFFWKRVASYKHALGDETPVLAHFFEPFVAALEELPLVLLATVALWFRRKNGDGLRPYARGAACSAALVVFLALGALGGGMPTHHAPRALLPIWFFLACVLGHAAEPWLVSRRPRTLALGGAVFVLAAALSIRDVPADIAKRELELHIGDRARSLASPALLVDTSDYGYLAVCAAFQRPSACTPLDDHDPRKGRPRDAFGSPETLRERLAAAPNAWLVATDAHAPLAAKLGAVRARSAGFALVEPAAARGR